VAARVLTDEDLEPLRRELAELRQMVAGRSAGETLTTEQAAEVLGVAPKTVRLWAREGRIQGLRRGRSWRFTRARLALPAGESPEAAADAAIGALHRPRSVG
jgi:excisionase family DNA binding protein